MKVFIAGNAGFIGGYLTRKLIAEGHSVVGFDINTQNPQSGICECITGDICDKEAVVKAIEGKNIDIIMNLAAKHHDFGISEKEFFDVNEKGTKILTECASLFGVEKFLFFSSVAVYGNHAEPVTEDTRPLPVSFYGKSKLAGEKVLESWVKDNSERGVIVMRPVVVFGPENYANMYHLIKKISDRKFIFVGKGNNIKSVAYVENVVAATMFLLDRFEPGIDYFNYSCEPQMPIREIVDVISRYSGVKVPRLKFPLFLALILAFPFDILEKLSGRLVPITAKRIKKFNTATHFKADKIRKTGFAQPFDSKEGFKRTLEWFKKLNFKD